MCVWMCCVSKWLSQYMYNHYVGEGYDIASLICPIPFHVRWNKICLNQMGLLILLHGIDLFTPWDWPFYPMELIFPPMGLIFLPHGIDLSTPWDWSFYPMGLIFLPYEIDSFYPMRLIFLPHGIDLSTPWDWSFCPMGLIFLPHGRLPLTSKILQCVVFKEVYNFLHENNIISINLALGQMIPQWISLHICIMSLCKALDARRT